MDAPSESQWKGRTQLTDTKGERTRQVTRIGLDIAKNGLQVPGVDEQGKVVVRRQLSRSKVLPYFAPLPGWRVGREAVRQRRGDNMAA